VGSKLPEPVARVLRPLAQRLGGPAMTAPVVPPRRPTPPRPAPLPIPAHHIPGREALVVWPAEPPPGYKGQLEPDFQRELAAKWDDVRLEDCYFYHSVLLPDGSFIKGPWDLIGNEKEYLGGIDLKGRTVFEYGPASGWLTHYMSEQGADVTIIDIGWDLSTDLIPLGTIDLEQTRREQVARAGQVVNSWWYVRNAYGHSAKAVYAPVYDLPPDLGRFDVSVFGSILLHLRDPFMAMEQAATVTDDAIVVVEPLLVTPEDANKTVLFWNPSKSENPNGWWLLPPGVITDMLAVLGFPNSTVSYHRQYYVPETNPELANEVTFFTVVARRH
jgi:hypothetical protein